MSPASHVPASSHKTIFVGPIEQLGGVRGRVEQIELDHWAHPCASHGQELRTGVPLRESEDHKHCRMIGEVYKIKVG